MKNDSVKCDFHCLFSQRTFSSGVATDSSNNVYATDSGNNTIRKITHNGVVTTLAGMAGMSGLWKSLYPSFTPSFAGSHEFTLHAEPQTTHWNRLHW